MLFELLLVEVELFVRKLVVVLFLEVVDVSARSLHYLVLEVALALSKALAHLLLVILFLPRWRRLGSSHRHYRGLLFGG